MKSVILTFGLIVFVALFVFAVWYGKKIFFDPMIEKKIDEASDLKAQSLAEVLSEKKSEEIAAIKVADRTRAIEERLMTMDQTLVKQNICIQQLQRRLYETEMRNETLVKENHLLNGYIKCKENEIQDLEVLLSNRNCQITRLKHCRDQLNIVKNHFKYQTNMSGTKFQELMVQKELQTQL